VRKQQISADDLDAAAEEHFAPQKKAKIVH
jgi:hypothetical protein